MIHKIRILTGLLFVLLISTSVHGEQPRLRLATTTSTDNSGLLAWLHPLFEKKSGTIIDVIAVGTGKALRLGSNGDVDVVLVHAPPAEKEFIASGNGIARYPVMHNDFVLIGPADDPADIESAKNVYDAMYRIALTRHSFISRGDDSGTHKKEKSFWENLGVKPQGKWYISAGQSMGSVILMANEIVAYTLVDRGTYLAFRNKIDLKLLFQGDPPLHNPYHVIAVNPEKHAHVNFTLAQQYIRFLTSPEAQERIASFRVANEPLFYPDVISKNNPQ